VACRDACRRRLSRDDRAVHWRRCSGAAGEEEPHCCQGADSLVGCLHAGPCRFCIAVPPGWKVRRSPAEAQWAGSSRATNGRVPGLQLDRRCGSALQAVITAAIIGADRRRLGVGDPGRGCSRPACASCAAGRAGTYLRPCASAAARASPPFSRRPDNVVGQARKRCHVRGPPWCQSYQHRRPAPAGR